MDLLSEFYFDVDLSRRKRRAVACFGTQLSGPEPILPAHIVARLTRSFEVLLAP